PGAYPLEQTIAAFDELHRAGKIRFYGVSNFAVPDLRKAVQIAGERRIACNQVLYHLEERAIEHEVIPWCERHEGAVVGYRPFGCGQFPRWKSGKGRVVGEIARARGATARQVALRFLVRQSGLFAIPKASNPAHVEDNARAGDLELSPEELARIDSAFPLG